MALAYEVYAFMAEGGKCSEASTKTGSQEKACFIRKIKSF